MTAADARERRFPNGGHLLDQPMTLLMLAGLHSVCEDKARDEKEKAEKMAKKPPGDIADGLPPAMAAQLRRAREKVAANGDGAVIHGT